TGKEILVIGGGDSAIESTLLLAQRNHVVLSYRKDTFSRLKPKNNEKIKEAIANGRIDVRFNTNLISIEKDRVRLMTDVEGKELELNNDRVYIFAGGELPTQFLQKIGLNITKKFGEAILKH
ncbi:MAG: NAD(P)-binding domain-containing protein, partial [Bacteroidales bacterium]|nr:NAD(P)-binding domain-containing protein [Bacteroidales bacterium]